MPGMPAGRNLSRSWALVSAAWAGNVAPLAHHVRDVVLLRAGAEVCRVDAGGVVAGVHDDRAPEVLADIQTAGGCVGMPMGKA